MEREPSLVPPERVESLILVVRGQRVMLDSDLARLYGTRTSRLNEQVQRNRRRFPPDFMFELTAQEATVLRSQTATSKPPGRGGRRYLPLVFTEQGVAMLSSVLNSERAVEVNILIMRAFVKLRKLLASHADLARRLDALERNYDSQFRTVFDAIRELMKPPSPKKRRMGLARD